MRKYLQHWPLVAGVLVACAALSQPAAAQQDVNVVQSVDEPAMQPYQTSVSLNFAASPGTEGSTFKTVLIPAGKRLVIQYVSAGIVLSGKQPQDDFIARASIATTFGGSTVTHFFIPVRRGADKDVGFTGYSLGQETHLYTDGKFVVTVIPNSLPNTGVAAVAISGYLVDLPAPRVIVGGIGQ